MRGKRAKRILRFFIWFLLTILVLAVSIPLWFPWLLRPTARRFGATFQTYERGGYTQFAVRNAAYTNRNVRVHAGRIEVAPWRRQVRAEDWSVMVTPSGRARGNAPASVRGVYQRVSKIVSNVQHRIPQAALTNGYLQTPKVTIQIPDVRWSGANLSGQAQIPDALPLTTVHASIPENAPVRLQLLNPALEFHGTLISSNNSAGLFIHADNRWRTNVFRLVARFGPNGALPESATLIANSVVWPPVKGDLSFSWEQGRYALALEGLTLKQPVQFKAQLTGDTNSARIEAAEIGSPWARAKIDGDLSMRPGRQIEFSLSGRDLHGLNIRASSFDITGLLSVSNGAHRGSIVVQDFATERLKPFDLTLNWSGQNLELTNIQATAAAGRSAISVTAAADLKQKHVQLTELWLGTHQIDFSADVRWPASASICAHATNLSAELVSGFVELPHQDTFLDHLRMFVGWTNGPLAGDIDFAGRAILNDGTILGADGALAAHGNGLTLTNLTFTRNAEPVSTAYGRIPVSINPTKPFIRPHMDEALQVYAGADPKAFFWKLLETRFGVGLREPDVRAELSGTWNKPQGRLSVRAAAIKFRGAPPEVPPFDTLALLAHIHEDTAEIEFLNFFVTNQPVTFSGRMPLPADFWKAPQRHAAKLDWRNLACRLKIDSAQIAAFVPLLPWLVAPQGVINADLGLVPGGKLDGELRIDGAATRPIAALGVLHDVEILCRFAEDKAHINSYTALGGYSVLGAGRVHIDPNRLLRRELPAFEFHLTGENVPLTRQPDAVVRADLDVTLNHVTATAPVVISGKLHLRDSLYLRELRDLVPGKLASAGRRPPYFSVEAKPFADWRLNLTATGHRFLKVRTPIFNGEISADLRLSGTLAEPLAIGDVTIDAGLVRFPFGNIPVSQGIVSLTSDNPYRPQLLITGNDRVLGYDINMELAGFAEAPVLQFSSTPPLSSEQILLMLTAGEIPRQGQFAFTTEERAQRLAFFLGRGVLTDLGLGGDSNRLTIRSGEHISETGRPTYSVEYELTEDWSVIGQYDRFNDFNLMLKWRVYSR
jgi:hypothetical protein